MLGEVIQYFRKELEGRGLVLATDCSSLAPALYDADRYFVVQRMGEFGYLETILEICRENRVRAVLSLIDPELSWLARHKSEFLKLGAMPIVSDYETVEMCLDKYQTTWFSSCKEL